MKSKHGWMGKKVNTVLITEKQARMGGKKVNTVLAIKPLPLGQNFGDSSICHTDGASLKTGTRRRRRRCYAHGELFISNNCVHSWACSCGLPGRGVHKNPHPIESWCGRVSLWNFCACH
jgi:hypothetical protein